MTTNRIRSVLVESPKGKVTTPLTPRISKLGTKIPTQSEINPNTLPRLSVDRSVLSSPRSIKPKSIFARGLMVEKNPRPRKGSELQAELTVAREDLKKAKEELNEAKRQAYEANVKLEEALAAQKKAKECIEIEKFRCVEGIVAAQMKEEAWEKEMEKIRSQHDVDASALLLTTQELEWVKHELKIAESNEETIGMLSIEVNRLKTFLDSELERKDKETEEKIMKMSSKLIEMEHLNESLRLEMATAKKVEIDIGNLSKEWKRKMKLLELKREEVIHSERSKSESLASAVKELEECKVSLFDAESEIVSLKGKVESLQMEIISQKNNLNESDQFVRSAKNQILEVENTVQVLKSELRSMERSEFQDMEGKKDKALHETEISKDEQERSKRPIDCSIEALKMEDDDSKAKRSTKEDEFVSFNKQSEEEINSLEGENEKSVDKLKLVELEASAAMEEDQQLTEKLNQANNIVARATEPSDVAGNEFKVETHKNSVKEIICDANRKIEHRNSPEMEKIADKGSSQETDLEHEPSDEDYSSSNAESGNLDQCDEKKSLQRDQSPKKKSPLLQKFGKILRKKNDHV